MDHILDKIHIWADKSIVDELLVFAALIAVVETCAQNTLKNSEDKNKITFIIGLIIYSMVGYVLHYTYKNFPLSKVNVVWSCLSIVIATSLGYMLYNESMNSLKMLSVVLALGAVYCSYKAD